jgi:hypothetical protein
VRRQALENKTIGLYFESEQPSSELFAVLQELYSKYRSSFEVIYVSAPNASLEDYNTKTARMSWLAIPFSHAKRRASLFEHFEINDNQLVLLESSGATICRDGRTILSLGKQWEKVAGNETKDLAIFKGINFPGGDIKQPIPCATIAEARSTAAKEIGNDPDKSAAWDSKQNMLYIKSGACVNHPERSGVQRGVKDEAVTMFFRDRADEATVTQRAKLEQIEAEMVPLTAAISSAVQSLAQLRLQEKAEISAYIEEPQVPEDVSQALSVASQALKDAKTGISLLRDEKNSAFVLAQTVQVTRRLVL